MKTILIFLLSLLSLFPSLAAGADGAVRVSVFDFETSPHLAEGLGPEISDLINAYLSVRPDLELVERSEMEKILAELGLSGTGHVDQEEAVRIGRMVGAQVLITGRVFPIDGETVIVSRIIGTETTRVFGTVVKGLAGDNLSGLIEETASGIAATIKEHGSELLPAPVSAPDTLALIRQAADGRTLPRISIKIYEERAGRPAADSVAETEMISILRDCGFEVILPGEELAPGWVKTYLQDSTTGIPRFRDRVDVLLAGEAFSESAEHTAPFFSSRGRVEIRAIEVSTGRILAIARRTETGADLLERASAAAALEKATIEVAAILIPEILNHWSR